MECYMIPSTHLIRILDALDLLLSVVTRLVVVWWVWRSMIVGSLYMECELKVLCTHDNQLTRESIALFTLYHGKGLFSVS